MTIIDFIKARLDEDELWARSCSAPPEEEGPEFPEGVHWRWIKGPEQTTVRLPTDTEESEWLTAVAPGSLVWLATEETWARKDDEEEEELPGTYSEGIHLLDVDAAVHIVRHDPARVLAEVAAKRAVLDLVLADQNEHGGKNSDRWNQVMRLLALPYQGHRDYRKSWAPR
ncbi:hypothetical protein GCM10029992_09660 [Glycomyces albus]